MLKLFNTIDSKAKTLTRVQVTYIVLLLQFLKKKFKTSTILFILVMSQIMFRLKRMFGFI